MATPTTPLLGPVTHDPDSDEQQQLKRQANSQLLLRPVGSDLTEPQAPLPKLPRVDEAEQGLLKTAKESFGLSTPGVESSSRAMDLLRRIEGKPEPIPPGPGPDASYLDQAKQLVREAGIAYMPASLRSDQRAPTAAEAAQLAGHWALEAALPPETMLGATPLGQQFRELIPAPNLHPKTLSDLVAGPAARPGPTPEEQGIPAENSILYAMRVLGTTAMGVAQETLERVPTPDVVGAVQTATGAGPATLGDIATAFFTPSDVSKQLLGFEPGELQHVRLGTGFDWAEGILERVEQGQGLGRDIGEKFAREQGEDRRWVGTVLGTALDTLVNWEGGLVKGPAVLAAVTRKLGTLRELAPDMPALEKALRAVGGSELNLAGLLGPRWIAPIERGERSIDELPGWWRARAEEVAQVQEESALHEVAADDGLAHGMAAPVEDVGHQTALQAARQQAVATRQQVVDQLAAGHVQGIAERDAAIARQRQHLVELERLDRDARARASTEQALAQSQARGVLLDARAKAAARAEGQVKAARADLARLDDEIGAVTRLPADEAAVDRPLSPREEYNRRLLASPELRGRLEYVQETGHVPDDWPDAWKEAIEEELARRQDTAEARGERTRQRASYLKSLLAHRAKLTGELRELEGQARFDPATVAAPADGLGAPGELPELSTARKHLDELVAERGKFERRKPTNTDVDEIMARAAGDEPGVFTKRRTIERTGPVDDTRPVPPEFDRPATSAADWWRKIQKFFEPGAYPQGGYRFQRHMGWNRMLVEGTEAERLGHAGVPIETVERPEYVLRNKQGDVLHQGTLADMIHEMTDRKRMRDGDTIWWQDKRPVAKWSRTLDEGRPKIQLGSDYLFTSPLERRLIQIFRESDPRGRPLMLRGLAKAGESLEEIAGRQLAEVLTDAPPGARPTTRTGQILQQALELGLRDRLPARVYKPLMNGALVPKGDYKPIMDRAMAVLPLSQDRAAAVLTGAKLTAEEDRMLSVLAARYGVARTPGALTLGEWHALRSGAVTEAGSHLADVRFRMRGTPMFVDRWWQALSDAHLNRQKWGTIGKAVVQKGPVAALSKAFLEDKLAAMPPQVRTAFRGTRVRLERVADDVMADFRALPKDATPAARMLTLARKYDAVHPEQLELASRVVHDRDIPTIRAEWKGERPTWLDDPDPMLWHHGYARWSEAIRDQALDAGRKFVLAHLLAAGHNVSGTDLASNVKKLGPELVERLYREAFDAGELEGPALQEALAAVHLPGMKTSPEAAIVAYTLQSRAEAVLSETVDQLLRDGIAVRPSDARRPAIDAMLLGDHVRWNPEAGRNEFRYPRAQITFAERKLRDWGIEPGSGADIKAEVGVGTRKVAVPEFIADDLRRLIATAQLNSRMIWNNKALDTLVRAMKEWTTHGVVVPNPPFFAGQMLSVAPTLIVTRGLTGALEAGATFFRHPMIVGELSMRLAGHGMPVFEASQAESKWLRTADGGLTNVGELERVARKTGLSDTHASYETATQLQELLARDGADYSILDPRNLVRQGFRWQDLLRTLGGTFDQLGRLSVYVAEAKRGVPLEVAAQTARDAMLDFRNLTEWESTYMRRMFTFYAFMRKTVDASTLALFHDPAAVLGQMRFANAVMRRYLKPLQTGSISDDDAQRMILWTTDDVVDDHGRPDPRYSVNRLTSTPIGPGEYLGMVRMLTFDDPRGLDQAITPLAQTLVIAGQGHPLFGDYDSALANRVPPALLDLPLVGEFVHRFFGVGAVPLRATDDPMLSIPAAKDEYGSGQPAVWAAGGDRTMSPAEQAACRKWWQGFLTWFSRPLGPQGTLESLEEAVGLQPHSPDITQEQSSLAALLGLRWRPVLSETAAKDRALQERAIQLGAAQDSLLLPGESRSR